MKTNPLKNQALIYDKDCPMCCIYTSAFINAGILEKNGRKPYSEKACDSTEWDAERAKNEIALVNYENGTVTYGIDSMFTVISHRFNSLKPLFKWKPFHWSMKKLYSFISYNRKVIAPPPKAYTESDCAPSYNFTYRNLYLISTVLFTAFINAKGLTLLYRNSSFWGLFVVLLAVITGRFALQYLFISHKTKTKKYDYLGHLATVNLQLGVLVAAAFPFFSYVIPSDKLPMLYLALVAIYINSIHLRRIRSIGMSSALLLMWLFHWVLIYLSIILILVLLVW